MTPADRAANWYCSKLQKTYPEHWVMLIRSAYVTAFEAGRNITEQEIADYIYKSRHDLRARYRNTLIAIALLCLWLGYKLGAR